LPLLDCRRAETGVFGIVMAGNGLLHLVGSIYIAMPGLHSAPIILAAAVYLLAAVR